MPNRKGPVLVAWNLKPPRTGPFRFGISTVPDDDYSPMASFDHGSSVAGASSSPYRRNRRKHGTHEVLLRQVPTASSVLDVGCSTGYLGEALRAQNCRVW